MLPPQGWVGQPRRQIFQLRGIVSAPFPCPVEKEYEWSAAVLPSVADRGLRAEEALAKLDSHGPGGDADGSFGVGLHRSDVRSGGLFG